MPDEETVDILGYRLTDMEFDEVSLCGSGVNASSTILLSKALPKKNMSPENCTVNHSTLPGKLPCPKCGYTKGEMKKAVAGSYEQRIDTVRQALAKTYPRIEGQNRYVYPRATFDSAVVYCISTDDKLEHYMAEYSFVDGELTLSDSVEVELAEIPYPKSSISKAMVSNALARSKVALEKAHQGADQYSMGRDAKKKKAGGMSDAVKGAKMYKNSDRYMNEASDSEKPAIVRASKKPKRKPYTPFGQASEM